MAAAEIFHRQMGAGRNGAVLISARAQSGDLVECVVKAKGFMENPAWHPVPTLAEWLAATLARELGVQCPNSYAVEISEAFAKGVTDPTAAMKFGKSVGMEYGAQYMRGFSMVRSDLLDRTLRLPAAHLLGFDLLIHNPDRTAANPNSFLLRDGFVAFDHGDAFAFLLPTLFAPDPATTPLVADLERHVVTPLLRGWAQLDFTEFRTRLAALTDERLAQVAAATPAEWCTGTAAGVLGKVLETLRRRRDAVDSWLPEVEEWLKTR